MKPKKEAPTSGEAADEQIHPLEVIRQAYRAMEIRFQEDEDMIFARLNLQNVEVQVISYNHPDDLALVIVRLPVRAAPKFRAQAGEFLHRLNFSARRKFWEIDHNDGEIRLSAYTDTTGAPLTESRFRSILHCLVMNADTVFPYLTSVLSGRMTPDFAADQADAATAAMWDTNKSEGEE